MALISSVMSMFQTCLLWRYIYDDLLKVPANEYPVLLTEPPFNPKPNRERITEIMFETFQVRIGGTFSLFYAHVASVEVESFSELIRSLTVAEQS